MEQPHASSSTQMITVTLTSDGDFNFKDEEHIMVLLTYNCVYMEQDEMVTCLFFDRFLIVLKLSKMILLQFYLKSRSLFLVKHLIPNAKN